MLHISVIFNGDSDNYLTSCANRGVGIQDIPQEFAGINTHSVGKQNNIGQNSPFFKQYPVKIWVDKFRETN